MDDYYFRTFSLDSAYVCTMEIYYMYNNTYNTFVVNDHNSGVKRSTYFQSHGCYIFC